MEPKSGQRKKTNNKPFSPVSTSTNRASVSSSSPPVEEKRGLKRRASTEIIPPDHDPKKVALPAPGGGNQKPVLPPRQTRSETKNQQMRDKLTSPGNGAPQHFGQDVSSFVRAATAQGGSLDEDSRHTMKGKINRNGLVTGDSWRSVVPDFIADHLEAHPKDSVFSQKDGRVGARKSPNYLGSMITSTRVNVGHGDIAEDKTIAEPSSPRPPGSNHRAHTSPFSLAGAETNGAKTVWASGWANVAVDSHIESLAKAESSKAETIHFRLDTNDRSTVGFASHNSSTGQFRSVSTNYPRRDLDAPKKAPKGTRKKEK